MTRENKKEINGFEGLCQKVNVLHKDQNNVLHQHNSHLVVYDVGTDSSIFKLHMCSTD